MNRLFILLTAISCCLVLNSETPVYLDKNKDIELRVEDALSRMTLEEKIKMIHAQSKFSTHGCPRLGIPEIWMSDGPHGVRQEISWDSWEDAGWTNDSCTAFPALTCLAATFNPRLSFEYGKAIGEEAAFRRKDVLLAPGVNIYRTPLNGRNFEYLGEDPFLASIMVVPYIQGVQSNGVAACLKHFALNNQETNRGTVNVEVSDRALHEIYLPAFKAGVEKGEVWTVMGAYNKFRGQHTTHHKLLVNKTLKGDWTFDGAFISDWNSTHSTTEAALYGLDIEMGTHTDGLTTGFQNAYSDYYMADAYLQKIKKGELSESDLDEKVRRVLRLNFRTNMSPYRSYGCFTTPGHYEIARKIAEEGIVLLKNDDNFFPIPQNRYNRILIVGDNATRNLTVGGGSSKLKVKKEISPLEGLISVYGDDKIVYSRGYSAGESYNNTILPAKQIRDSLKQEALRLAKEADIIIFIGGLNKNKKQDCESNDREFYNLPFEQDNLITELSKINKNIGVVIISGNAVAMPWINEVKGIFQSWYLGSEAGTATANIISGKVNPSGKLPFSIPEKLEDNGAHYYGELSYPGDSNKNVYYKEDILVGYRWHDTKKTPALFPFGYGFSYTTFKFGKISTDKKIYTKNEDIEIRFDLTNTGNMDGAETVQLYVNQRNPKELRPWKELKGFQKVFLRSGETKSMKLKLRAEDFAYYNAKEGKWTVEADDFTILCGASSVDIKSTATVRIK